MKVLINNKATEVPDDCTVATLLETLKVKAAGTAVAINNRLVKKDNWDSTLLQSDDNIVIISAAYGG